MRGIELAEWQKAARDAWIVAGGRGIIKVVTGAGKTVVALAIVEAMQRRDPLLRVAVVVPTIVLMNQWVETLRNRGNLPVGAVGMLGGGRNDAFTNECRILVAVLASARKDLADMVMRSGVGNHLLFIADECHRVGAPEMSAVLRTDRRYSLGLSATPERDDDVVAVDGSSESRLSSSLGGIVYEMSFAEAVRLHVLPPFDVHHFGLPLDPDEARQYEALSRSISDTRKELISASPSARSAGTGEKLMAWARSASSRGSSQVASLASRFVNDTTRRKQLLYHAASRLTATRQLVSEAMSSRPDARVILFHESIAEVVRLFVQLRSEGIPVVMEHSDLPGELRDGSLELFRTGVARVIVSARSLIEGFNVPEADLGVIVASSSSARQRIQSIGRVLRRYQGASGQEKSSRVCVLYVRNSVDDRIYEKEDWGRLIGVGRNRYFVWDPPSSPIEEDGPPRLAAPREVDIDAGSLRPGDIYPGRYEGTEFSVDGHGNVKDADGRIALNPSGVPALIRRIKGQSGRFRISPRYRFILVRRPVDQDAWETVFCGRLADDFRFPDDVASPAAFDASQLRPGDDYPGPVSPAHEIRFRQRGGGVLAKRVPGGEVFARGNEAERLIAAVLEVGPLGRVSRISVNRLRHTFWWDEGRPRFLLALQQDLQFPAIEGSHEL